MSSLIGCNCCQLATSSLKYIEANGIDRQGVPYSQTATKDLKVIRDNDFTTINKLEQQVAILKSAAGQMTEPDKKLFEKHINQYIKDIDKCIGLLSE